MNQIAYLTCNYCDYKWSDSYLQLSKSKNGTTCPKCGDRNVVAKKIDNNEKIDYYQGSPPFVETKVPLRDSPFAFLGYSMEDAYGNMGTD